MVWNPSLLFHSHNCLKRDVLGHGSDVVCWLAVLVVASGVDVLVVEDFIGLGADDDGSPVVNRRSSHATGSSLPRLNVLRLPAMLLCVMQSRLSILWVLGSMVTSTRAGSARSVFGTGFLRRLRWRGLRFDRLLLVESGLRAGGESRISGKALSLARYTSGRMPSQRAVGYSSVAGSSDSGGLLIDFVERTGQRPSKEPLL